MALENLFSKGNTILKCSYSSAFATHNEGIQSSLTGVDPGLIVGGVLTPQKRRQLNIFYT